MSNETNNANADRLAPGQTSGQYATVGSGLGALDAMATQRMAVSISTTTPVTLVQTSQSHRAVYFVLTAAGSPPVAPFTLRFPTFDRGFVLIKNSTAQVATIDISGQASPPTLAAGASALFNVDATSGATKIVDLNVGTGAFLPLAGGIMTGSFRTISGTLGTPGIEVGEAGTGLYLSAAGTLSAAFAGTAGNNFDLTAGGFNIKNPGGAGTVSVAADTACSNLITLHVASTSAPTFAGQKGRGSNAVPAVPAQNDNLANFVGRAWTTGVTYTNAGLFKFQVIAASPSGTDLEARAVLQLDPAGSVTLTEITRYEHATGFSMFGANPVIDQNRVFRPRSYTVGTVPSVTSTGIIHVSDAMGGSSLAYTDGVSWRRCGDDSVILTATVTAFGLLSRLTGTTDKKLRDLIWSTYGKLNDAGLLSKLKGLWVHALPAQADALRNWITPGTRDMTITGSPTFTANQGFTGDGSSGLLSTGAGLATFGSAQDDTALGLYILTASAASAAVIGRTSSTRTDYLTSFTSGALTARLNDATNDTFTPARYTGMFTLSRTGSANYGAYLDDTLVATITRASTVLGSTITFLGTTDATGSEFSTAKAAFSFVSSGLTASDVKALRSIMVDYFLVGVGAVTSSVANLPDAATFQTYGGGASLFCSDLGGGAGYVRSNGASWMREDIDGQETNSSDADFTLKVLTNGANQKLTATFTAARTCTLSTTNAYKGSYFRITRTGSGNFGVDIGGLITLYANQWAVVVYDGAAWYLGESGKVGITYRAIEFTIDGGGSTITTGVKGDLEIPFDCVIDRATLLADQSGSIVVNVWADVFANYPPTVADKITASAPPTITTATNSQDSTLTGWSKFIAAGTTLRFNVDSVTTIQRVTLSLRVIT
jgi:hypothetical protein